MQEDLEERASHNRVARTAVGGSFVGDIRLAEGKVDVAEVGILVGDWNKSAHRAVESGCVLI